MNALTARQETLPGVPAEPLDMLTMIYRATKDPDIDANKMMQLMEMAERFELKQAQQAFNVAMIAAQEEMDPVRTDATNPQTRSRYATWAALDRAIRPIYSKHGFALSFDTGDGAPADYIRVLLYVMHKSGHTKTYHMDMPADGKGAKGNDVMTKTHAAGSAFTYGKRYVGGGAFNIVVSDDDGNAADGEFIPKTQAQAIHNSPTMSQDPDVLEGIKNFVAQNKEFLKNCKTVAEIQEWVELREPELHRLKRRDLDAWNDLRKFKETRIANINLQGVKV
jgi:hypothetical protein